MTLIYETWEERQKREERENRDFRVLTWYNGTMEGEKVVHGTFISGIGVPQYTNSYTRYSPFDRFKKPKNIKKDFNLLTNGNYDKMIRHNKKMEEITKKARESYISTFKIEKSFEERKTGQYKKKTPIKKLNTYEEKRKKDLEVYKARMNYNNKKFIGATNNRFTVNKLNRALNEPFITSQNAYSISKN